MIKYQGIYLLITAIIMLATLSGMGIYLIATSDSIMCRIKSLMKFPLNCFLDLLIYLIDKRCNERGI